MAVRVADKIKQLNDGSFKLMDYEDIDHKPKINDVELSGNKSLSDLGLYSKTEVNGLLDDKVDNTDIVTSFGVTTSDSKIPSEKLVKDNLDSKQEVIPTYTLAEYEAIKDDIPEGALFNISDDETKVTNVTNNKYSTDQIICGEWIDGKPLYRKVVSIPLVNEGIATAYIYGHGSSALRIHSCNITISDDNHTDGYYFPNTYYDKEGSSYPMGNGSVKITANGQIQITCVDDWSGYTAQCIVEYTRTTD